MKQLEVLADQISRMSKENTKLVDEFILKLEDHYQNIDNINRAASNIDPFICALTIFILSGFVGYYIVWRVTPALHTPLMSITNAISAIIIISAMVATTEINFGLSSFLGYLACFFASINIFGGFVVTERMLSMFKRK
jgi:NAD(P) transhydrogenase subunit alpha